MMKLRCLMYPDQEKYSDKNESSFIVLPPSFLNVIMGDFEHTDIVYPMVFKVTNEQTKTSTVCSVFEFDSDEGLCFVPEWVFAQLGLEEHDVVNVTRISTQISKGTKITISPLKQDFWQIRNYKETLELAFLNYPVLSQSNIISVDIEGKKYSIEITQTEPEQVIDTIDCDIEIEFYDNTLSPAPATTTTDVSANQRDPRNQSADTLDYFDSAARINHNTHNSNFINNNNIQSPANVASSSRLAAADSSRLAAADSSRLAAADSSRLAAADSSRPQPHEPKRTAFGVTRNFQMGARHINTETNDEPDENSGEKKKFVPFSGKGYTLGNS
jgi:hypothetical protein